MSNLVKLSALAALSFATIIFGACGGGSGGSAGNYSTDPCAQYAGTTAYASCTATSSSTSSSTGTGSSTGTTTSNVVYTVTNGLTYVQSGTDTSWQVVPSH